MAQTPKESLPAALAPRTKGAASTVVASTAVFSPVRRASAAFLRSVNANFRHHNPFPRCCKSASHDSEPFAVITMNWASRLPGARTCHRGPPAGPPSCLRALERPEVARETVVTISRRQLCGHWVTAPQRTQFSRAPKLFLYVVARIHPWWTSSAIFGIVPTRDGCRGQLKGCVGPPPGPGKHRLLSNSYGLDLGRKTMPSQADRRYGKKCHRNFL